MVASRTVSTPSPTVSPAEAKSRLLETLLGFDDVETCADRALEWLGSHARVVSALCTLVEAEPARLVGVAAYRVPGPLVQSFSVSLEAPDNVFGRALAASGPTKLSLRPELSPLFDGAEVYGFPLPANGANGSHEPVGLLFLTLATGASAEVIAWAASALGRRAQQLRMLRVLRDAERRLVHERTRVYTLVNAVPDPILLTDTEGRLLLANARAEALFAAAEGQSEGRSRAVALNNMLLSAALAQRVIDASPAARRELPLVDPIDGSDRLYELFSTPVQNPEGSVVSVLRNVTDLQHATLELEENYRKLRQAEVEVRTERDRLTLIIDSVADPILVTSPAGAIVHMNEPAERLFTLRHGATAQEIQRVRANDAHFSSHISNLFVSTSGLRWHGEVGLVDPPSGRPVPVEAFSGKVLSPRGDVTAIVTILHDRTEAIERTRLNQQLERARDELEHKVREATAELLRQKELLERQNLELEQASALKSQFLANMSHEFRTPLNAILGYTNMLLQDVYGVLAEPQARSLSRVDSNARHLLTIINDILDISRIEAGRMPVRATSFRLPELIREVMAELEPLVARSKLTVRTRFAPKKLPAVRSDRAKVKQIVLNLLTNAIKFTPSGSVTVVTTYRPASERITIDVIDTGIGIASQDQDRVFDDFRQVDNSPTREYGGAGLGLSICRRLATVLGGDLSLVSQPGAGSTFTLALPRRPKRRR